MPGGKQLRHQLTSDNPRCSDHQDLHLHVLSGSLDPFHPAQAHRVA